MSVGKRIRKGRRALKWTQEKLGQELNVTGVTIGRWENGEREPDYESLKSLAVLYRVSTDYLLGLSTDADDPLSVAPVINDQQEPSFVYRSTLNRIESKLDALLKREANMSEQTPDKPILPRTRAEFAALLLEVAQRMGRPATREEKQFLLRACGLNPSESNDPDEEDQIA